VWQALLVIRNKFVVNKSYEVNQVYFIFIYIYIYIYIIVKIMATFHTDELLVSKAVGKCNVPFHIVHFVNVVGMWVSVPVPST
jgi:hypothetical protein